MEFLPSLSPELAGITDPSARGAAPLLKSAAADDTKSGAAMPFELCLALLTGPLPGGEFWPPGGKELPAPLEPAPVPAPFLLTPALAAAALQPRLPPGDAPLPVLPAGGTLAPSSPPAVPTAIAPPPVPHSELPTAATAVAPQAFAELELSAAWATTDAVPLEVAASEVASTSATAKTSPAPAWLETFAAHERRGRPPSAMAPLDPRAAVSAVTPPVPVAPAVMEPNAVAATDATLVAESAVRGGELPKILQSIATMGDSASTADWLQPAVAQGTTMNGAAAPPAVPGAPVDLRSPSWHETFTNRVQWLVDSQVGEARIKLNPPELGAVDVKISLVDDKTYVQLTTATAAARDELAQSLPRLRELFAGSGLELGGASVHNGRGEQHAGRGYGAGTADRDSPSFTSFGTAAAEVPVSTLRRSLGRIDVFA